VTGFKVATQIHVGKAVFFGGEAADSTAEIIECGGVLVFQVLVGESKNAVLHGDRADFDKTASACGVAFAGRTVAPWLMQLFRRRCFFIFFLHHQVLQFSVPSLFTRS